MVVPGLSANLASSPTHLIETTRRLISEALAGAPCNVRKENATASPGSTSHPITFNSSRFASTSGTPSELSFSNYGVPSNRVGLKSLFQLCEAATYSIVRSRGIGSSGTQNETVCWPSTK